jgi:hypothetical protein
MDTNMEALNVKLATWYRSTRESSTMPPIHVSKVMDGSRSWPMLHGRAIKAANTKALVPFLVLLCEESDDGGDPVKIHRKKAAQHLQQFYKIVYSHGEFLPADQSTAMRNHIFKFCHHYVWLHKEALARNVMLWGVVPKFHYFFHIGLRSDWMNPRWYQTYVDESMVGRIANLYRSCSNGPYHANIQKVALVKYLTALNLLLSQRSGV